MLLKGNQKETSYLEEMVHYFETHPYRTFPVDNFDPPNSCLPGGCFFGKLRTGDRMHGEVTAKESHGDAWKFI